MEKKIEITVGTLIRLSDNASDPAYQVGDIYSQGVIDVIVAAQTNDPNKQIKINVVQTNKGFFRSDR